MRSKIERIYSTDERERGQLREFKTENFLSVLNINK